MIPEAKQREILAMKIHEYHSGDRIEVTAVENGILIFHSEWFPSRLNHLQAKELSRIINRYRKELLK